jgi:hypothetical protein
MHKQKLCSINLISIILQCSKASRLQKNEKKMRKLSTELGQEFCKFPM